jgi:hypothetical protein
MNVHDIHGIATNSGGSDFESGKDIQIRRTLDLISAIILSVATVLSSWCAFQSSQWNGEQYFHIDDENIADNKRLQKEIVAVQRRAGESNYFLYYLDAYADNDEKKISFLESRFPPHLKNAIMAWKATDPLHNDSAPRSPFQMKEYVVPEILEAKEFTQQALAFKKAANQADKNGDNYLLLSIAIAMVLFFTGLSGINKSLMYQKILLITSIILLLVVMFFLIKLPFIL